LAYIKGELADINKDGIVIENNGMGYEISVPQSVMNELPLVGGDIKVYTYLYVREDALKLYGFLTQDDLYVFKLLITVNGIGPKGALGILSAITPDDLRFAILAEDKKAITQAPGIGEKTAGKLILELKDKLKLSDAFELRTQHEEGNGGAENPETGPIKEAVQALVALGYSSTEALKAARKVDRAEAATVEEILKQSLKYISL
ncbi:MAG: Holliday junction branch migration protein RuvA, partial [Acetivibrio sp.]